MSVFDIDNDIYHKENKNFQLTNWKIWSSCWWL